MRKLVTMSAAFALAATISVSSTNAATFIEDGGTFAVGGAESEFFGTVRANQAGQGSWRVEFQSSKDPLDATALATIGRVVSNQFENLLMSWVSVATGNVIASKSIVPTSVTLSTVFKSVPSDDINQYLRISWTDSTQNATFDVEVSTVPLPAGLVLLLSGLMGLGFLGRSQAKK